MYYIMLHVPFYMYSTQPYRASDQGGVDVVIQVNQSISIPSTSESECSQGEEPTNSEPSQEAQGGRPFTSDTVWMKVNYFIIVIIESLTMILMYVQGAPDMAVLIEQTPGVTLLVAEVSIDSCE